MFSGFSFVYEQKMVILACTFYMFCSVSMVLTNKGITNSYKTGKDGEITLEFVTMFFQALSAVFFCVIFRKLGYIHYPEFDIKIVGHLIPLNILFVAMLFTSLMRYLSVPMVTVFKNLTNILISVGEWKLYDHPLSFPILLSFLITISGAIMAAWYDLSFSLIGYFWMGLNCLSCAGFVLFLRQLSVAATLPKFGMVFYNNLISCLFILPLILFKGELGHPILQSFFLSSNIDNGGESSMSSIQQQEEGGIIQEVVVDQSSSSSHFFSLLLFSGIVGFFLNISSLWCVEKTSATTYAVVGSLNKVPAVLLGCLLFQSPLTNANLIFVALSLVGGFVYSWGKLREKKKKELENSKKGDNHHHQQQSQLQLVNGHSSSSTSTTTSTSSPSSPDIESGMVRKLNST